MAEININVSACKCHDGVSEKLNAIGETLECVLEAIEEMNNGQGAAIQSLNVAIHRLARLVEAQTRTINRNTEEVMDQLEDIVAQVQALEGVGPSVIAAINGLAEYIRTHTGIDPTVRAEISARLASMTQAFADAVQANPVPPGAPTTGV